MKVIVEGTNQEINEFKQSDLHACFLATICSECVFNSDVGCTLKNKKAFSFLKEYAKFKVVDTDKTIDNDTKMSETQAKISKILGAITRLLLTKNSRYGNSILDPIRVFCKKDKEESDIPARLDDKLSRIKNSDKLRINDVTDLIGYLVLLLIQLGCTETDILKQID